MKYDVFIMGIRAGEFEFEDVLRIGRRNKDVTARLAEEELWELMLEYDRDALFFGSQITWTMEDVVCDFAYEMLVLEGAGVLEYFWDPAEDFAVYEEWRG